MYSPKAPSLLLEKPSLLRATFDIALGGAARDCYGSRLSGQPSRQMGSSRPRLHPFAPAYATSGVRRTTRLARIEVCPEATSPTHSRSPQRSVPTLRPRSSAPARPSVPRPPSLDLFLPLEVAIACYEAAARGMPSLARRWIHPHRGCDILQEPGGQEGSGPPAGWSAPQAPRR